jgi:hypothetical protein
MIRARLSENRSTAPTLREGDLLVANLFPVSVAIHQVSFVVRADGRFESSERITASRDRHAIYHKETGVIPSPEIELIHSTVQAFANVAEPIFRRVMDERPDPFEAETADRRSLGYKFRTEHRSLTTWMFNYDESYDQRSKSLTLFNEIWQRLLGLLVMRYFTFDVGFAAPVRSLADLQ